VRNRGGHSSKPRKDNAIYQLSQALGRLEAYRFEPMQSETTRAYFDARQKIEPGALGNAMRAWLKDPKDGAAADIIEADDKEVGLTRTRCVPTRLFAGHADNALPQLATAMINCRIFPGINPNAVKAELDKIANDPNIVVTRNDPYVASISSPLRADVTAALTKAVTTIHPGPKCRPVRAMHGRSAWRAFPSMASTVPGSVCPTTCARTARTNGCRSRPSMTM
jgi:acetylornithine deacetylase/succinyl-diaminopimelate desuccinylase-like protein